MLLQLHSMLPNHTFTANSHVEVTKDDELVCVGNSGDDSVEIFIKLIFDLIYVGHGGSIGADKSGELLNDVRGGVSSS